MKTGMPEKNDRIQASLLEDYDRNWSDLLKEEKDYEDHIRRHWQDRWRFHEAIKRCLDDKSGQKVLELGCGTAIDLNIIADENPEVHCFGSDISDKSIHLSIKISKLFNNSIQYFLADARSLPVHGSSFDLVFSQGLVEHFKEPLDIVREQARILRDGGILIINVA
jgi:ubiquinone/menaquinone biosynthesis C-methylase UbiE